MADFDPNFNPKRNKGRFGRNRGRFGGGRDRDRGRDRSRRVEMHSATCDKCGKDCEVPFKPTSGKPLYCSDCFKDKNREAGSKSGGPQISNDKFNEINKKLDKILGFLEGVVVEEAPEIEEEIAVKPKKAKKKNKKKK